jgi:hypothetical protein
VPVGLVLAALWPTTSWDPCLGSNICSRGGLKAFEHVL